MLFYLGTPAPAWLARLDVPLFVSDRRLRHRRQLPRALGRWALDSGAFSELSAHGRYATTDAAAYATRARRYDAEVGGLDWCAPLDWMCEPFMLARTGLTVAEHQDRTIASVVELRALGLPAVPVLQGYRAGDYLDHVDAYARAGFDLEREAIVGLGSICRRQATGEAARIVAALTAGGMRVHGFGVSLRGLQRYGWALASADSMAWSVGGRRRGNLCGDPGHDRCSWCQQWALLWRDQAVAGIGPAAVQLSLFEQPRNWPLWCPTAAAAGGPALLGAGRRPAAVLGPCGALSALRAP